MQDAELLLSLAGIAGVFVGFGALISVRSGEAAGAYELSYIRGVVWMGLMVVLAAVVPVVINRYGITGHALWLPCSVLVLGAYWAMVLVNNLMPEHRSLMLTSSRSSLVVALLIALLFFDIPMHLALIFVILGWFPDLEPALYITAVALLLAEAAFALLSLAYSQGRPKSAVSQGAPGTADRH